MSKKSPKKKSSSKDVAKKAAKSSSKSARRGPGRPPKPEEKRLLVIGTRVSPRVHALLQKKADKKKMSVSSLLRTICRDAVKMPAAA